MHNKKKSESEKTPDQEALEREVDAMMDPRQPKQAAQEPDSFKIDLPIPDLSDDDTGADEPEPRAATAPEIGAPARKTAKKVNVLHEPNVETLAVAEVPAGPLQIDTLDNQQPAETVDITEQSTDLDDDETDKAVEDIVSHEGDTILALQDAATAKQQRQAEQMAAGHQEHHPFKTMFWFLVALLAVLAGALAWLLFASSNLSF